MTVDPTASIAVRLGQRVRQLRKAAGLTQDQLGLRCSMERSNLARLEVGFRDHVPKIETLLSVADGLGVELTDLVGVLDRRWVLEETWRRERAARGAA